MRAKALTLSGWGRVARVPSRVFRPERTRDALAVLAGAAPGTIIARGAGRSYGDVALNAQGATLLTTRLDRLLAFDAATGVLECEPGVTLGDLAAVLAPRGRALPVVPGTAFVTVGGAVANDVHGKNHDRAGGFGDHLAWIDLARPDGTVVRTAPDERADLFAATVGGLGLTGLMVRVALRTVPVPSAAMIVRETRHGDLDGFMAALAAARGGDHVVGWIDAVARGPRLGRGVLQVATPAPADAVPADPAARRRLRLPFDLPGIALNRHTVGLFNEAYWRRIPAAGRERTVWASTFHWPLDAVGDWNRMYGRKGFRQFQCVIPDPTAARGIPALMQAASDAGAGSFLAVLKTLGTAGRGLLSFAEPGFTLALDLAERAGTADLVDALVRIALDHGGRVYLAKDSRLTASDFREMYPRHAAFAAALAAADPAGRLSSDMARRLDLRGAA